MIIFKYALYYSFIGIYQSGIFLRRQFGHLQHMFHSWNETKNEQGQTVGFKTTLLRTAFRSIL